MAQLQLLTKLRLYYFVLYFLFISFLISSTISQQTQPKTPVSTDPSYYYNLCAPSMCNNLSLPYPFALPTSCHPSNVEPLCPTNQSFLLTSSLATDTFRVLSFNYNDPTLARVFVASVSLFTCGTQVSRQHFVSDASIFSLPSNYTPGTHLNCTGPIPSGSIRGLQNASCIGCSGQDPNNVCYYAPGFASYRTCQVFQTITPGGPFNATSVRDLRALLQSGYEMTYSKSSECHGCELSGGRCGSRPTSGSLVCFCPSSVHPMNCSDGMQEDLSTWVNGSGRRRSGLSKAAVAGISASASASFLFLIMVVSLVIILIRRRRKNTIHFNKETISSISPTRYSFSQLKKYTNNFSTKLGEGGFSSVYKGTIHRSGTSQVEVAVKMLKKSKQTQNQFMNEVETIGSVHHHNLVTMLGYCVDGNHHGLVYEFVENGSLDKYIYSTKKESNKLEFKTQLSYKQMYNIALETARGILYLHQGCRNKILHCDIKPPNVLLDSNFSAKVADFGLARLIDKDHSHVSLTGAQGTPGYAAPEMWLKTFGPVTDKSDVYSYGMLLLEMIGRRKNYDPEAGESSQVYFPEWLYNKVEKDEIPLIMRGGGDEGSSSFEIVGDEEDEKAVQRLCLVGLSCIQHVPSNRPNMDRVVQMLEGHVEIGIPPNPFPQQNAPKNLWTVE